MLMWIVGRFHYTVRTVLTVISLLMLTCYLQAGYASGDPEKRVSLDNSDDIDISDRLICAFSIDQHHLQDLLPGAFQ